MDICRPSLVNQKHNVGWFLLKRFVDLFRVCYLHTISRNNSNIHLLMNLMEKKSCPQQKTTAKAICSDSRILTVQTGFCSLVNVYFNQCANKKAAIFIKQPLGNSPSLRLNLKKDRPKKTSFLQEQITELYQLFDGLSNNFLLRIPLFSR